MSLFPPPFHQHVHNAENPCLGNQGMALNFVPQQEIRVPVPTMPPGAMSLKGG